jgi:hypothetical protein
MLHQLCIEITGIIRYQLHLEGVSTDQHKAVSNTLSKLLYCTMQSNMVTQLH